MIEPYYLQAEPLLALGDENRQRFAAAEPFPHAVLDDFLPEWVLDRVLEEFPDPGQIPWKEFKQATSKSWPPKATRSSATSPRHLLAQLNAGAFLQFLERLTGIDSLIPDPYFEGGGLHQIEPGGFLKVHADFNGNEKLRLNRRLNALIYLNKDWQESYGGALELWDREMTHAVTKVLPVFNRCVVLPRRTTPSRAIPNRSLARPAATVGRWPSTTTPALPPTKRRPRVTAPCTRSAPGSASSSPGRWSSVSRRPC